MALLESVKKVLRVTSNKFDDEIQFYIDSAIADMHLAGIITDSMDENIEQGIKLYCKINFGNPPQDVYARLLKSYEDLKKSLSMTTGYTDWLEDEV